MSTYTIITGNLPLRLTSCDMEVEAATENASLPPTEARVRGLKVFTDGCVCGCCDLEHTEPPPPPAARLGAIESASLISRVSSKS